MKKILTRVISLILLLSIMLSATACTQFTSSDYDYDGSAKHSGLENIQDTTIDFITSSGTVNYYLKCYSGASNGDYYDAKSFNSAQSEFNTLFNLATGKTMPTSGKTYKICMGTTSQILDVDSSLPNTNDFGRYGYRIITKNGNVYIYGNSNRAVLYGTYTFMDLMFGYDTYTYDCTTFTSPYVSGTAVKMKDFNVIDIPDIEMIAGDGDLLPNASASRDQNYVCRMRYTGRRNSTYMVPYTVSSSTASAISNKETYSQYYSDIVGQYGSFSSYMNDTTNYVSSGWTSTNSSDIMRASNDIGELSSSTTQVTTQKGIYGGEYQKMWFSDNTMGYHSESGATSGGQWCFTAHGDEDQFKIMTTEVAKIVGVSIKNNSSSSTPYLLLMQEDNIEFCDCDACVALREKYGTISASMCIFFNEVMKIVKEYYQTDIDDYDSEVSQFKLLFNPYSASIKPAITTNENGDILPADEKLVLDERIGIYIAYNLCPNIEKQKTTINGWFTLLPSNTILLWDYPTDAGNLLTPNFKDYGFGNNNWDSDNLSPNGFYKVSDYYSNYYRLISKMGVYQIFMQLCAGKHGGSAWLDLRSYVYNKLAWDCNRYTVDELMNRYFTQVYHYEEVASCMKTVFNELKKGYELKGIAYKDSAYASYLTNATNAISLAKNILSSKLDSSDDLYGQILNNIIKEEVAVLYTKYLNENDTTHLTTIKTLMTDREELQKSIYVSERGGLLWSVVSSY